jgi:hypothetical protein
MEQKTFTNFKLEIVLKESSVGKDTTMTTKTISALMSLEAIFWKN